MTFVNTRRRPGSTTRKMPSVCGVKAPPPSLMLVTNPPPGVTSSFSTRARAGAGIHHFARNSGSVHARQTDAWPTISRFVGDADLTHDGVDAVREALEAAGSKTFIEDFAAEHLASARRLADEISLPDGFTGWFESVTRDLARRAA